MNETAIQKSILAALHAAGRQAWRLNAAGGNWRMRSNPGFADILTLGPGGRATFIEVKTSDGELRPAQAAFQTSVERAGGVYLVARSVDDVLALLRSWGRVA